MGHDMKIFIRNLLLFFLAIIAIDITWGIVCQYLNDHSKGGGIRSRYYVCKQSNEDVLIFGSSRAKHHYVPEIIEDSLGLSCYNTGEDGNGIILSYGFLRMITSRYEPKVIIYDISDYDIYEDDNVKYLNYLKPYYHETGIDSLFWSIEPKTRLMMCSNLYRFNTTCLRVLGNYFHPITTYPKGYMPLYNTMNWEPKIEKSDIGTEKHIDSIKMHYFEQFIMLAKQKGIAVFCCVSPKYKGSSIPSYYSSIMNLCEQYKVPFLYYCNAKEISNNRDYFQDPTHLNDEGARQYTSLMLRDIIKLQPEL